MQHESKQTKWNPLVSEVMRVAVVDDHPLMRAGIIGTLASDKMIDVIGEGETAEEAILIAGDVHPDIMLVDINEPGHALAAVREIRTRWKKVKCVMLTVSGNDREVDEALELGVDGYILKGVCGEELKRALRRVFSGQHYVSPELVADLVNRRDHRKFSDLTAREFEIVELLPDGLSNKEIGKKLDLTEKSVKYYVTGIFRKLGVKNRVEAAVLIKNIIDAK